jgi:hypothetical protein
LYVKVRRSGSLVVEKNYGAAGKANSRPLIRPEKAINVSAYILLSSVKPELLDRIAPDNPPGHSVNALGRDVGAKSCSGGAPGAHLLIARSFAATKAAQATTALQGSS